MSAPAIEIERPIGIVIAWRRSGYGWFDWNGKRVWIHIQSPATRTVAACLRSK